ncbi:hypothetical protein ACSLGG_23980 [Bacillus mycoides]|uniref:hypothetical protein n=1 Tax=Bacillus mycoides TaxID=1405 RepID=UPI003F74C484
MEILIVVGCLLTGIIFIGLSIYRFVKEIKETDSKKDKMKKLESYYGGIKKKF